MVEVAGEGTGADEGADEVAGVGAADRILVAQLTGEARHRAKWRELSDDEEAAAVAGLQALADGRSDLLAEVAGIFEGTSEGELDEPCAVPELAQLL